MMNGRPYLKLKNQELPDSRAGYTPEGDLWLFLEGFDMSGAVSLLYDGEPTGIVEFHAGPTKLIYEGFEEIVTIMQRSNTRTDVQLRGGGAPREEKDEADVTEDGADGLPGGRDREPGDVPAEQQE